MDNSPVWSMADRYWIQESLDSFTMYLEYLKRISYSPMTKKCFFILDITFQNVALSSSWTESIYLVFISIYHSINFSWLQPHSCWKMVCPKSVYGLQDSNCFQNSSYNWKLIRQINHHWNFFVLSNYELFLSVLLLHRNKQAALSYYVQTN